MIDKKSLTNLVKYVTLTRLYSLNPLYTAPFEALKSIVILLWLLLLWELSQKSFTCESAFSWHSAGKFLSVTNVQLESSDRHIPFSLAPPDPNHLTYSLGLSLDDLGQEIFIIWDPAFSLARKFEGCNAKMLYLSKYLPDCDVPEAIDWVL